MIGRTIGSYQITGHLGEGGMAVVYKARHVHMGTDAAVGIRAANMGLRDNSNIIINLGQKLRLWR